MRLSKKPHREDPRPRKAGILFIAGLHRRPRALDALIMVTKTLAVAPCWPQPDRPEGFHLFVRAKAVECEQVLAGRHRRDDLDRAAPLDRAPWRPDQVRSTVAAAARRGCGDRCAETVVQVLDRHPGPTTAHAQAAPGRRNAARPRGSPGEAVFGLAE
jgi:hypothetical protein